VLSDASVVHTSQVRASAMLLLPIAGIKKYEDEMASNDVTFTSNLWNTKARTHGQTRSGLHAFIVCTSCKEGIKGKLQITNFVNYITITACQNAVRQDLSRERDKGKPGNSWKD
jgi:hypothetical protein